MIILNFRMLLCLACGESTSTIDKMRIHLMRHQDHSELTLPLKCSQKECCSSLRNLINLIRHINTYHKNDENHNELPCTSKRDVDENGIGLGSYDLQLMHTASIHSCLLDLQAEA
jgi:hypothetical protein